MKMKSEKTTFEQTSALYLIFQEVGEMSQLFGGYIHFIISYYKAGFITSIRGHIIRPVFVPRLLYNKPASHYYL